MNADHRRTQPTGRRPHAQDSDARAVSGCTGLDAELRGGVGACVRAAGEGVSPSALVRGALAGGLPQIAGERLQRLRAGGGQADDQPKLVPARCERAGAEGAVEQKGEITVAGGGASPRGGRVAQLNDEGPFDRDDGAEQIDADAIAHACGIGSKHGYTHSSVRRRSRAAMLILSSR